VRLQKSRFPVAKVKGMENPRILITSAGRRVQLVRAFRESIGRIGIPGAVLTCDASSTAPASYEADENYTVPRIDSRDYVQELLILCEQHRVTVIVPTIDTELALLSSERESFLSRGTRVIVSQPETIEIASSKRKSHEWLEANGFSVPQQWWMSEILSADDLTYPLIAKPDRGSMSQGVRLISSNQELINLSNEVDSQDYVIESIAEGKEFTVSTYVDRFGTCLAAVPRLRMEVRAGEVSKATTVRNELLETTAKQIVESLPGAYGPLNVQMFLNFEESECQVIEINARFGGGDPLAWRAGANAPEWIVRESLGVSIPVMDSWISNLTMLRFDDAIYLES